KEIKRMVEEGKQHETEDKQRREQVETRNRADQLCYQVEKALEETKDKLPADKIAAAKSAVAELRSAIDKQDHEAITRGMSALEKLMGEIAQKAYESAGAAGGPSDGAPGAGPAADGPSEKKKDDVIDAEFEEGS